MSLIPGAISVVIPTYNRAHLIIESLQSVLDQTLQPYEIIVVDDFSTDNTEEVVKSLNSSLIKFVKNTRKKGANGARNTGILMAQGEYIAFHDSDDIWLPEKLYKQYHFMLKNRNLGLSFCLMNKLDGSSNFLEVVPRNIGKIKNFKEALYRGNLISTQVIFMKAEIASEILFDENLKRLQDWDFILRIIENVEIGYLDEVLVNQKVSKDSITSMENIEDAYRIILNKYPYIHNKGLNNRIHYLNIFKKGEKFTFLKQFIMKILRRFL